ncbi:PPOX oxidase, partial [Sapayoa aenigma]|nr:PPOX oxidase [Sapayoa aenigma]
METLARGLVAFLSPRGVELRCHAPLCHLGHRRGRWQLTLPDGTVAADHVISALPAAALAKALPAEAEPLAQELRRIPAASVAVVNLQYEGVTLPVTGFGHLVPSSEDAALLGIVYDSVAFPQHDGAGAPSVRLTVGDFLGGGVGGDFWGGGEAHGVPQVMLGGAWFRQSFGDPAVAAPELLLRRAREAVRDH